MTGRSRPGSVQRSDKMSDVRADPVILRQSYNMWDGRCPRYYVEGWEGAYASRFGREPDDVSAFFDYDGRLVIHGADEESEEFIREWAEFDYYRHEEEFLQTNLVEIPHWWKYLRDYARFEDHKVTLEYRRMHIRMSHVAFRDAVNEMEVGFIEPGRPIVRGKMPELNAIVKEILEAELPVNPEDMDDDFCYGSHALYDDDPLFEDELPRYYRTVGA